ncbi:helix-turn-helix domain-containing protein [Actinomadura graeca]|uniref:Helix-turn-helix domain-containing protein n=1 Tax=Actinomadura graeca TaxID=2750812 RepID=A0ABX8R4I0_9ACTN|nr:helix-turn-helix domain-containing protein [Actinomadura graeca]QXJ25986.1 helix-turn-helix domain-containing protein [Actinomadura graeca]
MNAHPNLLPSDEVLDGGPVLSEVWYTTEQLAVLLAVDPSTLRRWRTGRPLQGPPFVRLSGAVTRYNAADVRRWMLRHRIDPDEGAL